MGRFARQYPLEAVQELYRLTLDAAPPLKVPAALEAIRTSREPWACSIKLETARAYVRDERRKRGELKQAERREDASGLRDRLLKVCAREVERVERRARGPKAKVDPAHVRTLGQAIRELETGTAGRSAPTRARDKDGSDPAPRKADGNGKPIEPGSATARMLERARQTAEQSG